MALSQQALSIPVARGGPVTDQTLDQIIAIGLDAQTHDRLSNEHAALIMMTLPQITAELLARRRAMGVIENMVDLDNVTFLPCG